MSAGKFSSSLQDFNYIFKIFENKFGKISVILLFVGSFLLIFSEKLLFVNSFLVDIFGFGLDKYIAMGVYNSIGLIAIIAGAATSAFKYLKGENGSDDTRGIHIVGDFANIHLLDPNKVNNHDVKNSSYFTGFFDMYFRNHQDASIIDFIERKSWPQKILDSFQIDKNEDAFRWIEERVDDLENKARINSFIYAQGSETRSRLFGEVQALGRRGNLNLIIGMLISVFGISFLGWSVINLPTLQVGSLDFWGYFLTRSIFVTMIEIVAFFFLNLYRSGLNEIKYFQNEITNLDYKIMGLMASSYDKSHKAILDSGKLLMNVERNYLLKKGETTIEIEKEKMAPIPFEKLAEKLLDVMKNQKYENRKGID